MLSTSPPPLGLAASAAVICPPTWLQKSAPCLWHFQFTVAPFAVTGTPRPFGIKCFVSQVLVFSEKWPPTFSCCLCTHCYLGTCQDKVPSHRHCCIFFQKKIHDSSFEKGRKWVWREEKPRACSFFLETNRLTSKVSFESSGFTSVRDR